MKSSDSDKEPCSLVDKLIKTEVLYYFLGKIKQWPLAGEFVELEYSPKICQFWRIRVLAKMAILENWPDSIHLPTFANLFWSDSIHSPTFAKGLF